MLFIEYPKCTTCKRAKKYLEEHKVTFEDRHIVEDNPTKEELTEWIKQYTASDVEALPFPAGSIRHWRGYIQNSWKYGKSNGLSEGLNNKVKVLKRVAFGLHSFESFRKRILLTCGKLRLSKDPLSVLEDARNGKEIRL